MVDLNGDGKADILLNHGRSNIVTILLNDGKGGFSPRPPVSLETGASSYAVAASDINNDNHVDLMIVTVNDRAPFDSKIVVLAGDARGAFNPAPGSPLPAAPGAYTLATGDINGDGKLDLVASSFESDTVTVLLGQ